MKLQKLSLLGILFLLSQCQSWGKYNRIDLAPRTISQEDVFVEGRSCRFILIPLYPNLHDAITDALAKAPGKKGIKNPEIIDVFYMFSPIIRCTVVKGYATNEN
ncbi:Hypothetical lipoprotein [Leptospira biflexa serovar Patoc strain 'Patoc 1 (Ames)']|uniref:hypothetical protein n=1 Tax=Leptospira biflexa TaxID=172 RepID=UPI000165A201|nr:hypothetical protein [Leptospira biflexa]ABZ93719.1 Hypothetical lipoprotein [Leptospira biflexa serovar Patoc strain 'Patoc 1 (Ames)']